MHAPALALGCMSTPPESAALTLTPLPGGFVAALDTLASLPDASLRRLVRSLSERSYVAVR